MKRSLFAVITALVAAPALAGDVSATIAVSQPGFFGQITIGDLPRPTVIYAQPVWVHRPAKVVYVQPVYMRVPPGHEKHWSKHCGKYNACGRPVYFVREDWYQEHYVPRHQHGGKDAHDERYAHDAGRGQGQGKGQGNGKNR